MPGSRTTRYAKVYAWSGMRVPPMQPTVYLPSPT